MCVSRKPMFVWCLSWLVNERSECLAKNQFVNGNEEEYVIFVADIYRVLDNNDVFIFLLIYLFLVDRSTGAFNPFSVI